MVIVLKNTIFNKQFVGKMIEMFPHSVKFKAYEDSTEPF